MNPDYDKMVREFLTPTVALFLFIFLLLVLAVGNQILKKLNLLERVFGHKTIEWIEKEGNKK